MTVQYFQAEPDRMPEDVFSEHHIQLNLQEISHGVQNMRNGVLRGFTYSFHEVIVSLAGTRSGWRWFAQSDVIVVTLDPQKVTQFAQTELGMLLDPQQFDDFPQFHDPDLCAAGVILRDALEKGDMSSGVMFEAMSRVFLVKLLQKYGRQRPDEVTHGARFTASHYERVLSYIQAHLDSTITVDDLAAQSGMSKSQFTRVFKETLGTSPMQFVMAYRIEQAIAILAQQNTSLSEISVTCGRGSGTFLTQL